MYNKLYDAIMKVDFKKAELYFNQIQYIKQKEIIEQLAYETESMIIYEFIQYINTKNESINYHEIIIDILTNALCHIEGAYQIAYFHNQRLLELVPDSLKYLEWELMFYDVKVIDYECTMNILEKIIKIDKENQLAKSMIGRLNN